MILVQISHILFYLFILSDIWHIHTKLYNIQYKNKPYSDNNEYHGSVILTDAQHEIKLVKNYNEMLKTILHYISKELDGSSFHIL